MNIENKYVLFILWFFDFKKRKKKSQKSIIASQAI